MKLESLVTVNQPRHGEYVPESCTHNKRARQVFKPKSENLFLWWTHQSVAERQSSRVIGMAEGLEANGSPNQKAG